MQKILLLTFAAFQTFFVFSQNDNDLFRYSKTTFMGTARFESMAGSFGALGADLSSSQINPAGYGRFSSSQFGFSLYGGSSNNNAIFANQSTQKSSGIGGLSNVALVYTEDLSEKSTGFMFRQIGIGFNQIERFKNSFQYKGTQFASLLDEFVGQAQGYAPSELNDYFPFSTELAYETGAITYSNSSQSFSSLLTNGDMIHNRTVNSRGGIGEFFVSYSANYLNKLYIGANIGIRSIRNGDSYSHKETLIDTANTSLRSFQYDYTFFTKGHGVNFKIGGIYLVNNSLRLGLALHSSTYSELQDAYEATMTSNFSNMSVGTPSFSKPTGNYKYKVRNPGKIIGSFAYVFGLKGCINVDVEYLDYKRARFKSTDDPMYAFYDYAYENEIARNVFKNAVNFRIGGEWIVFSGFYIRGGFAQYGNAYLNNQAVEAEMDRILTGGIGIKTKTWTIDFAYKQRSNARNYFAFSESETRVNTQIGTAILSATMQF
jgi:hypothetical protein